MENYEHIHQIGEGTYGTVYKCFIKGTKQAVAVKKFKESEHGDNQVMKTAMREVGLLRSLADHHEHIVTLLDVFRHRGKLCLVFEYVEGTVLQLIEHSRSGLKEAEVKRLVWQLLQALQFLHDRGIMHRDVKPENLLVSRQGILKLCDFGFARRLSEEASTSGRYTAYVATRWYRAPELLLRERDYTQAVDIWAVGCLVAEMLTGYPAFPGQTDTDQLNLVVTCVGALGQRADGVRPPSQHHRTAGVPHRSVRARYQSLGAGAVDFLEQCLKADPAQRPSAAQLCAHPWMAPSSSWMTAEFQQARQQAAEEARAQHATLLRRQRLQMATADVLQLPSVAKPTQPKVGSAGSTATHISADARNASSSSTPSPAVASAEMHNAAGAPALTTNGPLPASRRAPSRASAAVNPPSRLGLGSHKMPALGGGRHAAPATAHGHSSAQMHGTGSVSPGRASPYLVRNQHKTSISSSGAANGAQRAPATSPGKRSALSRDGSASPSSPVRPPATRSMRVDTVTAHNRIITPPMKAKDESLPSVPEGSGKEQHDCKAEGTKPGATEMSPTHPKSQTLLARLLRPKNPKSKGMGSPKP